MYRLVYIFEQFAKASQTLKSTCNCCAPHTSH